MGKLAQASDKYIIRAGIEANGVVEKPDIVGAIFGQTEGLLGAALDLRELQQTGRIGRIEVEIENKNGASSAIVSIPSSLDATETSLIAAGIETIDRIGPCTAKVRIDKIEDIRITKRDYIIKRAKDLLYSIQKTIPEPEKVTDEIKKEIRISEITDYEGLPAGPLIRNSDSVILVEGRADVINLLKNGIKNAVAMGGTSVAVNPVIHKLANEKTITVFLDGDRGGELILKELSQIIDIDYVAYAPQGKEVEELTRKEIFKALREKTHFEKSELSETRRTISITIPEAERTCFKEIMANITGTRAAYILDNRLDTLGKLPISELFSALKEMVNVHAILIDGYIDNKFVALAEDSGANFLVGTSRKGRIKKTDVKYITKEDLERA